MKETAKPSSLFLVFATGFGLGLSPAAPGTAGTLLGILLYRMLSRVEPFLLVITVVAFVFVSVWIADRAARVLQEQDPSRVVIDEISGYMMTMLLVPWNWAHAGIGFVLFRFFDIVKPFPIRWIDRNVHGGWGIVLDDVLAGVYANVILQVIVRWI